jgi:hypothetical protein
MGGFGAWQTGWSHLELFSSIATLLASLSFKGVSGYTTPGNLANALDRDLMLSYSYDVDVWRSTASGSRTGTGRGRPGSQPGGPHTLEIDQTGGTTSRVGSRTSMRRSGPIRSTSVRTGCSNR